MEAMGRINGRDGKAAAHMVRMKDRQKIRNGLTYETWTAQPRYTTELDETFTARAKSTNKKEKLAGSCRGQSRLDREAVLGRTGQR